MTLTRIALCFAALLAMTGTASAKDWTAVRVGIQANYPPFNGYDGDNNLAGFDVDIANALCAEMKAECGFVVQNWEGLIDALIAEKFDAIVSSMSITEEREERVDFTDKYYTNSLTLVAARDPGITDVTPDGLAGKTLGAEKSTVSAEFLKTHYGKSKIKLYAWGDDSFVNLTNGRNDAVLTDAGKSIAWLKRAEGGCCAFVGEAVVKDDLTRHRDPRGG
jgi:polar amino acid transport system substrate-binding protein